MRKKLIIPIKLSLTCAMAMVIIALFAVTEVMADDPNQPVVAPQECELRTNGGALRANIVLSTATVPCPGISNVNCSAFNYDVEWFEVNPSHVRISVSADRKIFQILVNGAVNTSHGISDPGDGVAGHGENIQEIRIVTFNENANTFTGTIITDLTSPRIGTAIGEAGKFEDSCLILTPGVGTFAGLSAPDLQINQLSTGEQICSISDPITGCETFIDCETQEPLPTVPITDVFGLGSQLAGQGAGCFTFDFDNGQPNTTFRCSGGRCRAY